MAQLSRHWQVETVDEPPDAGGRNESEQKGEQGDLPRRSSDAAIPSRARWQATSAARGAAYPR